MKKKNGFTLVELLAVIVILAIIMIIAIPSVLDVMNSSRKKAFKLEAQKIMKDAQTQFIYDANLGTYTDQACYYYTLDDLKYSSTGDYTGYAFIDARDSSSYKYYIYLHSNNYETGTGTGDTRTAGAIPIENLNEDSNIIDKKNSTAFDPVTNSATFITNIGKGSFSTNCSSLVKITPNSK